MPLPPCDVIIPARNAAATLSQAITSVLSQTARDLRLIVVDDGSTDATASIARGFAADDQRVTVLRQTGGGISAAMNAGIAAGNSPFVARLDADDMSAPDRHAMQIAYLVSHPRTVAISGAHKEIRADGSETGHIHRPALSTQADAARVPAVEPPLTQPFFMVRRDALEAVGGYRPFPVSEDSDLYWRLSEIGALESLPEIMGSYRLHQGSISSASIRNGRLMALCSQLAALSFRRRAAGRPDITLPTFPRWREAEGLEAMIDEAATDCGLSAEERAALRLAAAGKLMELAGYRPYELDTGDCRFIAAAMSLDRATLDAANRTDLDKMRAATTARLLRGGHLGAAWQLSAVGLVPQTLVRAATGRLYWAKHPV
jgi:GT2 family glycosyltransferase